MFALLAVCIDIDRVLLTCEFIFFSFLLYNYNVVESCLKGIYLSKK